MGFLIFLIVNVMLFVRPGEVIPSLEGLPLYNYSILACLALAVPRVVVQLSPGRLADRPITVCCVGFLGAIILSHASRFAFYDARVSGEDFFKVLLYYLLLVGLVDSPGRLRTFLFSLVGLVTVLSLLALAHYHNFVNLPALEALDRTEVNEQTGEVVSIFQLRSTGIFNDPNDLCLILVVGMAICLYCHNDRRLGLFRFAWLVPMLVFGYALLLTRSRGGFLAMLATLMTFMGSRLSIRKAVPLGAVVLPLMFVIFGGRSTNISASDGTAQSRMQLWAEGLDLLRSRPLFGIGQGMFAEEIGHVAHNSFIHAFTELGFFGGTFFVGAFYCAILFLVRLGSADMKGLDPELGRLRSYILAMVVGYAVGLYSLSRNYVVPTYLVFGLVTAYQALAVAQEPAAGLKFDIRLCRHMVSVSAGVLVFLYTFTRLFARYD